MPELDWLIAQKNLRPEKIESAKIMFGTFRESRYFSHILSKHRSVVILDWGDTEITVFDTDTHDEINLEYAYSEDGKDDGYHFFDLADGTTLRVTVVPHEDDYEWAGVERKLFTRVLLDDHLKQLHSSVLAYKERFQQELDFGDTSAAILFKTKLVPAMTLNGAYAKWMVNLGVDRGDGQILDVYASDTMDKISRRSLSTLANRCGSFLGLGDLKPIQFRNLADSTIMTLE